MINSFYMRILLVLTCFLQLGFQSVCAQKKTKTERFPSYFGIVASPIIPNNFIGAKTTTFNDTTGAMTTNFINKWGYTFGATIRIGLTKTISIETGITQVHRNYIAEVSIPDSGIFGRQKLSFVNYDVPINALFYVQLDEKWFMDASLGISVNQYPTDVRDTINPGFGQSISVEGRRIHRTSFATNAGIGFEYRTEKAGTFFLGASAKVPFQPIFMGVSIFKQSGNGNDIVAYAPVTAGYFSIDFRYFFPKMKKKDPISNKPLIE